MRVLIAPDKFKGSLTAPEAADAIARGVLRADPQAHLDLAPMADGGEGTVEALVVATGGTFHTARVSGPLGTPIEARYGWLGDGRTAVIEMAAASGLVLSPPDRRDVLRASTRGTGELLLKALAEGASRVILGIGGSATNDGGAGLAQALGIRLLDADGFDLGPGGAELARLDRIDASGLDPRVMAASIAVARDVINPLCGPTGASAIYGPQKGATPEQVAALDANLDHLARIIARDLGLAIRDLPGAGAAGGLGGGLVAFAGGRLEPGVDLVSEALGLSRRLARADLCLTGEGSLDHSTVAGKTVAGVARRAQALGVPTLALAGTLGPGAQAIHDHGIAAYFSLCPAPLSLDQAITRAAHHLENVSEQVVRAFLVGRTARRGHSPWISP